TGSVQAGSQSNLGGLAGFSSNDLIGTSYSAGKVTVFEGTRHNHRFGGFIGDSQTEALNSDYWDVDTSGYEIACGQHNGCPTVTGLSDAALKSGLPPGFDPTIWAQNAAINNGYPYLIANPPQ